MIGEYGGPRIWSPSERVDEKSRIFSSVLSVSSRPDWAAAWLWDLDIVLLALGLGRQTVLLPRLPSPAMLAGTRLALQKGLRAWLASRF